MPTVTYNTSLDTYTTNGSISGENADAHGSAIGFYIGDDDGVVSEEDRAYLYFATTGTVPGMITAATITLVQLDGAGGDAQEVQVHLTTDAWDESITWDADEPIAVGTLVATVSDHTTDPMVITLNAAGLLWLQNNWSSGLKVRLAFTTQTGSGAWANWKTREHADTADRPLLTITYTTDAPQLRWRTGGTTYYRNLQAAAPDEFAALGVRVNGSTYYAEPDGDNSGVELCIRSGGTTYRFAPTGSV